jgi:hypothetical protein
MTEKNPEISKGVYGGSLSPEDFMNLEFNVSPDLPEYEQTKFPEIALTRNGLPERTITPMNSSIVEYGEDEKGVDWEQFNHVLILGQTTQHFFYNENEQHLKIAAAMAAQDFPVLQYYKEPTVEVKNALYKYIINKNPINRVINRMIDEATNTDD